MMHGPLPERDGAAPAVIGNPLVVACARAIAILNSIIAVLAAIALVAACVILSDSVIGRALFNSANYWQDEAAVFLLVGATFMTAAYVQGQRGHIGIEAFVGLLSPLANRIRLWISPACCSVRFSPGNPGRWRTRPGSTARSPTRCGRRRSRSPMA